MSEKTPKTPKAGWIMLRAGGNEPSGISIPTRLVDVGSIDGPVRLALGPNGEARILLPLGALDRGGTLTGAPALGVTVSDYVEAGRPQRFLDISCLDRDLETVFAELTDHILVRIEAGQRCLDAARSAIEEFRALLVRPSTNEIAQTKIAGLVGELLVLKRLLDRSPGAWSSWRGPAMDRHDFARGSNALEVKTSMGRGRTDITINGLEQMTAPASGKLFLQHFELEVAASAMLSVASLGRAVLEAASRPDEVRSLLAAMDCSDVLAPEWNGASFRLEGETLYEVADGFPRLVSSSFPDGAAPEGVSKVSYSIKLAGAAAFRINPANTAAIEELFLP